MAVSQLFGLGLLIVLSSLVRKAALTSAFGEFSQDPGDEFTTAILNITYKSPDTGESVFESLELGKFSSGKISTVTGIVVHVRTRNGSSNYGCEYPFDPIGVAKNQSWIALIKRGQCTFNRKILHAAQSNASAVIVYDDRESQQSQKMHHRVQNLVAIFIPQEKGEELADLVDNGTSVTLTIGVGTHQAFRYANINRTSVLFVSISFVVLMIISLAWLVFYYIQRFRYIHAKDQLARRLCTAAKKALAKIPLKTIKVGDKETDGECECCAVCIEPYKLQDVVRILPCKHVFHKSCVDPWLLEQRTCPMCKMDILKFYGLAFTGSQESVLHIEIDDSSTERSTVTLDSPGHRNTTISTISSTQSGGGVLRQLSIVAISREHSRRTAVTPTASLSGRPSWLGGGETGATIRHDGEVIVNTSALCTCNNSTMKDLSGVDASSNSPQLSTPTAAVESGQTQVGKSEGEEPNILTSESLDTTPSSKQNGGIDAKTGTMEEKKKAEKGSSKLTNQNHIKAS